MATRVKRVIEALDRENLRYVFDGIEQNGPEVVCWRGVGYPFRSVKDALRFARTLQTDEELEAGL